MVMNGGDDEDWLVGGQIMMIMALLHSILARLIPVMAWPTILIHVALIIFGRAGLAVQNMNLIG